MILRLLILAPAVLFRRVQRLAAVLLPYLAWIRFAGQLAGGIWRLNH